MHSIQIKDRIDYNDTVRSGLNSRGEHIRVNDGEVSEKKHPKSIDVR